MGEEKQNKPQIEWQGGGDYISLGGEVRAGEPTPSLISRLSTPEVPTEVGRLWSALTEPHRSIILTVLNEFATLDTRIAAQQTSIDVEVIQRAMTQMHNQAIAMRDLYQRIQDLEARLEEQDAARAFEAALDDGKDDDEAALGRVTALLSEPALGRIWDAPGEDEAWRDL